MPIKLSFTIFLVLSAVVYLLAPAHSWQLSQSGNISTRFGLPYTGFVFEFGPKWSLKSWVPYVMGKKWGREIHWHPSGQRWLEREYVKGVPQGQFKGWHANGKAQMLMHYVNGNIDGERWTWHANGQVAEYALFKDGKEIAAKAWIADGKPFYNYVYQKGVKVGIKEGEFCRVTPKRSL